MMTALSGSAVGWPLTKLRRSKRCLWAQRVVLGRWQGLPGRVKTPVPSEETDGRQGLDDLLELAIAAIQSDG